MTTSRPRATTSSRSAASTSPPTAHAALRRRHRGRRALHAAGSGRSTAPDRDLRRRHRRAPRPAPCSTRPAATSSTRPSTSRGAPTRSGGTRWAPTASDDVSVFHEPDERFWLGVGLTRSRRFLMIEAGSNITSETWLLDAADPTGEFTRGVAAQGRRRVRRRARRGRRQGPAADRAQRRRRELRAASSVAASDPQGPRRIVLPHNPDVRLEGVDAFRDFVAVEYRREGLPRVGDREGAAGRHARRSTTRRHACTSSVRRGAVLGRRRRQPRLGAADRAARATRASSPRRPCTTYVVATGELKLRKRQPVLGDYDADPLRAAPRVGDRRGRHAHPDLAGLPARPRRPRRPRADPALRLRLVRARDRPRRSGSPGSSCSIAA